MSLVRSAQAGWRPGSTPGVATKPLRHDKDGGCVVRVTTPKPVRFVEPRG